jgi:hypothetical protein
MARVLIELTFEIKLIVGLSSFPSFEWWSCCVNDEELVADFKEISQR